MESMVSLLAGAAVKATALLAVAALITTAWRTASASARHLIWTIAVLGALLLPVATVTVGMLGGPQLRVPLRMPVATVTASIADPESFPTGAVAAEVSGLTGPAMPAAGSSIPDEIALPVAQAARDAMPSSVRAEIELPALAAIVASSMSGGLLDDWQRSAIVIWALGAFLALLPVLLAVVRIRTIARKARPVPHPRWKYLIEATPAISHHSTRVRVLESGDASMPMTWGLVRPTLLVPAHAADWPDWKCRNILLHELGHVERRDCLTQLAAQVACAVYWFNPLAWHAAHRMRVERELACDDRVLSAGAPASDYAANLLEVARSLRAPSFTSHTAIAMARPSQLSGRLLAVLDSRRNRNGVNRRVCAATAFSASALVVVLASLTTRAAIATAGEAPSTRTPQLSENVVVEKSPSVEASYSPGPLAIVQATQIPAVGIIASHGAASLESILAPVSGSTPALSPLLSMQGCWTDSDDASVSINNNSDDSRESWHVRYKRAGCSLEMRAEGKFRLRADLTDLESIDRGGWFRVEEREGRTSRRVEIRAAPGGLEHQYWVNGERVTFNEEGRRWLASTLLAVERRTAFAADTRVPQLYRTGGLRGVLGEISRMPSAYPKSRYYGELLDLQGELSAGDLSEIVGRVSADLASSDYYTSQVLGRLSSQRSANDATWRAFAQAAGRMKSDYYKSQLLKKVLNSGQLSNETVGALLTSASEMKSDYYLSDLLKSVASKYAVNDATRGIYASALGRIESDYYRMQLLKSLESSEPWDDRTSSFVLASVKEMKSDYYKSQSLISLVKQNHVDNWSAFFSAAGTIDSDHYARTTLSAALDTKPLTKEIVAGVVAATSRLESDHEKSQVLADVARSYKLDDDLRVAYEKAVDQIDSEHYRGTALVALRSQARR
jgi:beta-lactamase regulating signal transducer with metallopeptidase domain